MGFAETHESQILENPWGNPLVSPVETKSFHFPMMILVCITDIPDSIFFTGDIGTVAYRLSPIRVGCPQLVSLVPNKPHSSHCISLIDVLSFFFFIQTEAKMEKIFDSSSFLALYFLFINLVIVFLNTHDKAMFTQKKSRGQQRGLMKTG